MHINSIAVVTIACLAGCATTSTPVSIDSPGQRRVTGTVIRVTEIPTYSNATEQKREWMGEMYGAVGLLMLELLATKKGYPVYVVKAPNSLEMNIASFDKFSVGDCVVVWYPEKMGERPDLGLGKAGIAKSADCVTADAK